MRITYYFLLVLCLIILLSSFKSVPTQSVTFKQDWKEINIGLNPINPQFKFTENKGQWEDLSLLYAFESKQISYLFKSQQLELTIGGDESPTTIQMQFQEASEQVCVAGRSPHKGMQHRYIGKGAFQNIKSYREIWYEDIYPNIDVRYYGNEKGELVYDYVVYPKAKVSEIVTKIAGVKELTIDNEGTLELLTNTKKFTISKPFTYQIIDGKQVEIASKYRLINETTYGFDILEPYDETLPLIIDPTLLEWSTYIGGGGLDEVTDMLLSGDCLYVLGTSTSSNYPTTPGAIDPTSPSNYIAGTVSKFDTDGNLLFSTYLGDGSSSRYNINNIDETGTGCIWISGNSSYNNYPTTANALSSSASGSNDVVITKIDSTGSLRYGTYLGGSDRDYVMNSATWDQYYAVAGFSKSTDFPTTPNALPITASGNSGFVSVFDDNGSLLYSTILGTNNTIVYDLQFDNGLVYVVSRTNSSSFPTTSNAYQPNRAGSYDFAYSVIDPFSGNLLYSTYIGSSSTEEVTSRTKNLFCVSNGIAYFTGTTSGTNFPITTNAYQSSRNGQDEAVLYGLDTMGNLVYSTYLGGSGNDELHGLVKEGNTLYFTGITSSTDLPVTSNAEQPTSGGGKDLFYGKFDLSTQSMLGVSYLGGSDDEDYYSPSANTQKKFETAIQYENGYIYLTGMTKSGDFPTTNNAFQTTGVAGVENIFFTRIEANNCMVDNSSYLSGSGRDKLGEAIVKDGCIYIAGHSEDDDDFPVTPDAYDTSKPGASGNTANTVSKLCYCLNDIEPNVLSADQTACQLGTPEVIDGTTITVNPDTYLRDGVPYGQCVAYEWQYSTDGGTTWITIPGAVDEDYLPNGTVNTTQFRRIIGCDTSNIHTLNITGDMAPTVDPGTPQSVCPGGSVMVGGSPTATGGAGGYTYLWTPNIFLDNNTIPNPTATPGLGGAIYTLEVTDAAGCIKKEQTTVTYVYADAGPDINSCPGEGVKIGTPAIPNDPPITYTWTVISGDNISSLSDPNIAQPIADPNVPTCYEVTVSGPSACPVSDTVCIGVDVIIADGGSDKIICHTDLVVLGTPAQPDHIYTWTPGTYLDDPSLAQPEYFGFDIPIPNPDTLTLTVFNTLSGCSAVIDTVVVTVLNSDAGLDGCGPRNIGTPAMNLAGITYNWNVVSGDNTSITGQENLAMPYVDPNTTTTYALEVSLGGVICRDTVIVPICGCPPAEGGVIRVCDGLATNIALNPSNIDTVNYNYTWSPTTGLADPNAVYTTIIDTFYTTRTYTLAIIEKSTGEITSCTGSFTIYVNNPVPKTPTQEAFICPGESANIGYPAVVGFNYSWTPASAFTDPTLAQQTVSPTVTTSYSVKVTDQVTGCFATEETIVNVREPIADAGPDGEFCEGAYVELGGPPTPDHTYTWSPSGGLSDSLSSNPTITLFTGVTFYLTATDTLTGCVAYDTVTYISSDPLVADAGEDVTICNDGYDFATLGTSDSTSVGYTYNWSPTLGLDDPSSPNPQVNPSTTTTYYVIISKTNTQGCNALDEVTVTVNEPGSLSIDAGNNQVVCPATAVNIGPSPSTGMVYSWSPSAGLSDPTIANPDATVSSQTMYFLTVVDTVNCLIGKDSIELTPEIGDLAIDAGADQSFCPDLSVNIGPSSSSTGVVYSWSPSIGLSDPTIYNPIASPAVPTMYYLTAIDTVNCTEGTDSVTVTPIEGPSYIATDDRAICEGSETTIGAPDFTGATYTWSPSTGLDNAAIANPLASPTSTTQYIVTASFNGCTAKDTVLVTVNPLPSSDAGADQSFCDVGVTIGTPGSAGYDYIWIPSTGLSNATIAQPTAAPSSVTTYILSVIDPATGCKTVDEVIVTPDNIPNAGSDKIVCLGDSKQIGTPTISGFTYSWSPTTDLDNASIAQPTVTPTAAGSVTYTLTQTGGGCTKTDVVVVKTVTPPSITIDTPANDLCEGNCTSLSFSSSNTFTSFTWTPSDLLDDFTSTNPKICLTETAEFTLQAVNDDGCIAEDKVTVPVQPVPAPVADAGPDTLICLGESVQLGQDPLTNTSYIWTTGSYLSPNAYIANPLATPITDITYYLEVNDNGTGCSNYDSINIEIRSLEVALGEDIILCPGETHSFSPSITTTGSNADLIYDWTPGTGLSDSTIINPTATIDSTQIYTLIVTDTITGCIVENSISLSMYQHTLPMAVAGDDITTCNTDSVQIGVADNPNLQYSWSPITGLSNPNISNPKVLNAAPNTTTYTLTVIDPNIPTTCANSVTDQVKVNFSNYAIVNYDLSDNICYPESADPLVVPFSNPNGMYAWYPTTDVSNPNILNPDFTPSTTTTYTLTAIYGTDQSCFGVNTFTANVNPPVVVNIDPVTICTNVIDTTNQIINPILRNYSYNWEPASQLIGANTASPYLLSGATGPFTVTVTDNDTGCTGTATVTLEEMECIDCKPRICLPVQVMIRRGPRN